MNNFATRNGSGSSLMLKAIGTAFGAGARSQLKWTADGADEAEEQLWNY
jgi:hypothetical protein